MKKAFLKISSIILISVFILVGCNKTPRELSIENYRVAKENYLASGGIEFNKTIKTTNTTNPIEINETIELYHDTLVLDKSFNVFQYSSIMNKNFNNNKVLELNRYYKNSFLFIHSYNIISSDEVKVKYNTKYEDFYSNETINPLYSINNLIPYFNNDQIEDFQIKEVDKDLEVTFLASCPSFVNCEQDIQYTVIIDKYDNFKKISYTYYSSETIKVETTIDVIKSGNFVWVNNFPESFSGFVLN